MRQTANDIIVKDPRAEDGDSPDSSAKDGRIASYATHPSSIVFLSGSSDAPKVVNLPSLDIGSVTSEDNIVKDIVPGALVSPPSLLQLFESTRQDLLRKMKGKIGEGTVTESTLPFAPRWMLDDAIQMEKDNYREKEAYVPVSIRNVPRNSNVISSPTSSK